MSNTFEFLQEWFKKRSARDRLYLFFIGFAFFYLIYYIFFLHPVLAQKKTAIEQIASLRAQQITLQQQIEVINTITKTPAFLQLDAEQKRLAAQIAGLQQQLDNLKPALFSALDLPKLTKQIFNQQRENVILISFEELPMEPWSPTTAEDKTNLLNTPSGIYQHILQIEFQNNYFSTIDYLKRLEGISQYVYWDSMNYKVLQYPKADVVIKFHVLSLQKS